MTPINLAELFKELAEDESWPWQSNSHFDTPKSIWMRDMPITIARLALMVVEEKAGRYYKWKTRNWTECVGRLIEKEGINPDHYHTVRKRVEEAG